MKELIEKGYIYIAKPPLFKVRRRSKERYLETEDQLDKYLIELGSDDINAKMLPDKELSKEMLDEFIDFVYVANQIETGLRKHGLNPYDYFSKEQEKCFPLARITVREDDGTITEKYAYSDEEEKEIVSAAEIRLGIADENGEPIENVDERKSSQIEIISIFESKACGELAAKMSKYDLKTERLYSGKKALFEIETGEQILKADSLVELFEYIRKNGRQGLHIQRYKGLGEMNAEQLWETTMDPSTRKMIKVTMDDAVQAEQIFSLLMGDDVEPRREYIEKYAAGVKDLDTVC